MEFYFDNLHTVIIFLLLGHIMHKYAQHFTQYFDALHDRSKQQPDTILFTKWKIRLLNVCSFICFCLSVGKFTNGLSLLHMTVASIDTLHIWTNHPSYNTMHWIVKSQNLPQIQDQIQFVQLLDSRTMKHVFLNMQACVGAPIKYFETSFPVHKTLGFHIYTGKSNPLNRQHYI